MARPKRELSMAPLCRLGRTRCHRDLQQRDGRVPRADVRSPDGQRLEILLKARLVQQAGGKMAAIYRREDSSRRYRRDPQTREPLTIGLAEALGRADIPREVRGNISGLVEVRNRAAHLGGLARMLVRQSWPSELRACRTSSRCRPGGSEKRLKSLTCSRLAFLGHATATGVAPTVGQKAPPSKSSINSRSPPARATLSTRS